MKTKIFWNADTAQMVADAKHVKYGTVHIVVPVAGGGFAVVAVAAGEWKVAA